jgi:hypothetical protein
MRIPNIASMVRCLSSVASAAILITAATATSAVAQARAPTKEERTSIEAKLTAAGYKAWTKIEFEEGRWKIDAANHPDGKKYDLELDKASFEVVHKDLHK